MTIAIEACEKAPRVLHVRATHGRHGPERVLLEQVGAWRAEGIAPRVLALHRSADAPGWLEEMRAAGAPTRTARDPSPASPAAWRALRREMAHANVVHTHDYRARSAHLGCPPRPPRPASVGRHGPSAHRCHRAPCAPGATWTCAPSGTRRG